MPAMLDDPSAAPIWRTSGAHPFPVPGAGHPESIIPRPVTLRDRTTIATLMPIGNASEVPVRLMQFLCELLNSEIEAGDTYPMTTTLPLPDFGRYWFQNFAAIMILGDVTDVGMLKQMEDGGVDWEDRCLGSFYIKPNYPGRSSHVCNGGFLVSNASRNKGVGKLMGEGYLDWAPKLGYVYSVFNLVYETNTASMRIWDSLGFKRIGRVKGCGNLKSSPTLVDAIIYGRELGGDPEDFVSEERFDKIRYYLKNQKYPLGADRAEKSRLRSAATHYHLIPATETEEEKLMLKDKEVISDPQKQYEIARQMHCQSHGGINKTTATIAEKYHWVRIKETVSMVIKNCPECKDSNKMPNSYTAKDTATATVASANTSPGKIPPRLPGLGGMPPSSGDREITPPHLAGQRLQTQPVVGYEQAMATPIATAPAMSRDPSAARHSPVHHQPPVPAGAAMVQAPQTPQSHHQTPTPQPLNPAQALHSQMAQSLIPNQISNFGPGGGPGGPISGSIAASANITPSGSAIHSPLPNGPASAPISNMQGMFDGSVDPILESLGNFNGSMDTSMQGISSMDLDASMHDIPGLSGMGLGEVTGHHGQFGQAGDQSQFGQPGAQGQFGQGNQMNVLSLGLGPDPHGTPTPNGMMDHDHKHGHPVQVNEHFMMNHPPQGR